MKKMKYFLLCVTKRTIVEMTFLAVLFQQLYLFQILLRGATHQGHRFIV